MGEWSLLRRNEKKSLHEALPILLPVKRKRDITNKSKKKRIEPKRA
jgi:hypothetical protein